ncbi:hypothetical protein RvY_16268-1 [Ramazzottius varieornatus]|uniref:PiggyBac transposable element-derived protein domain-containing protein n=1 Tax=Ramazzottius varieornatus TaxID=947166 RepID=A0A1D1VXU9_RAMVA|nr:hypothetical protein RvY_16268-1 [Ramazzottius varieornatus]
MTEHLTSKVILRFSDIDESSKEEKPEIVMEYNRTKAGVDTLDQLTGNYSCRRKTSRWPMALFYDILDISALDAYIIWCEINPGWNSTLPTKRRMFLQDVSKKMMQRQLLRRSTTPSISFSMKKFVSTVVPRVQSMGRIYD